MTTMQGTVQSHTIIRMPDKTHATMAPFVLLLVELANGKRVLADAFEQKTPVFREEMP